MSLQLTATGDPGRIVLDITYPPHPNLKFNFSMTLTVQEQAIQGPPRNIITKTLHLPEKKITLSPIPPGKIYKTQCVCHTQQGDYQKVVFVFVPAPPREDDEDESIGQVSQVQSRQFGSVDESVPVAPRQRRQRAKRQPSAKLCNSQGVMRMVGRSVGIRNTKTLDRMILQGRKCRNTGQFLNVRGSKQSGDLSSLIRKQQMLLQGRMVLGQVYKQRDGMRFMRNDWFMGPFYSYDHNEEELNQNK